MSVQIALGCDLCQALGLPKETRSFTITAEMMEPLIVEAVILVGVDKEGQVIEALKRFELTEKPAQ